MEMKIVVCSGS